MDDSLELSSQLDPYNPDTDGDQMPDAWEYSNNPGRGHISDAEDDRDNDTWSNIQEYVLSTDPRDDTSHPTGENYGSFFNSSIEWVSGNPHLTWSNEFLSASNVIVYRSINNGDWEAVSYEHGASTSFTDNSGFTSCCSGGSVAYKIVAWYSDASYYPGVYFDEYFGDNDYQFTLSW